MHPATKDSAYARLNCRISARVKREAEEAAALLGQSITDFTQSALAEKAQTVFDGQERIILPERDFERFVAAIENPKPSSEKLIEMMREYQERSPSQM